ncbi:MAG TPA: PqqD family protein [Pyrinomonadaceae bacterium]|nr:PqqD family protein [Pyrinomonadaceae bacterium]
MNNSQRPIARKSGLVVQEVPDEVLVYDLESNKAHCLNQSAAMIWKSCDGNNSVSEIAKLVESQAGGKVTEDFVWLAIDQLSENNLLEKPVASSFEGTSRREVIKKIGLASVVAVPVIASLVAPQSALAAASCTCVNPPSCSNTPNLGCPSTTRCNSSGLCAP